MIRRRENGKMVITQMAHSWLAGQFALHWGNDTFRFPALAPDMILTAANHDLGWSTWEQTPQIDAEGRPIDFLDMPVTTHLALWTEGVAAVTMQNLYAGLLVSMHGRTLVEGRLNSGDRQDTAADKTRLQAFSTEQREWEAAQIDTLQTSDYFAPGCQAEALAANLRLLQLFDWLSLLLCMRPLSETVIADVPAACPSERVTINFKPLTANVLTIEPWPFKVPAFEITWPAYQLPQETFASDQALQRAWTAVRPTYLTFQVQER